MAKFVNLSYQKGGTEYEIPCYLLKNTIALRVKFAELEADINSENAAYDNSMSERYDVLDKTEGTTDVQRAEYRNAYAVGVARLRCKRLVRLFVCLVDLESLNDEYRTLLESDPLGEFWASQNLDELVTVIDTFRQRV